MPSVLGRIEEGFGERFGSVWLLLTQTEKYLGMAGLAQEYEARCREWRLQLRSTSGEPTALRTVREELVSLRRLLRSSGHEVSLGALDLRIQGFKNDAALAEGYSRVVVFTGAAEVLWVAGQDNHIELGRRLEEERMRRRGQAGGIHCLWYRWRDRCLHLAGADSESKEEFERFVLWSETHRLRLLRSLRRLP